MRFGFFLSGMWLLLALTSCQEKRQVGKIETRAVTMKDALPKFNATNDERFRDAKASPVEGQTPEKWLKVPSSQFRLLNYRFGDSGEVWVSLAQGSILDNANRWLGQFGLRGLDDAGLSACQKARIAGAEGVIIDASGTYNGAMGAAPRPETAMSGVIAIVNGQVLTVKMIGSTAEVESTKSTMLQFAESLKLKSPSTTLK